jgi:Domain of unknown function (DUF3598)
MSQDVAEAQLKNWDNFCQYHVNCDWYGTWNTYAAANKLIDSFKCIRSFHLSQDGSEIYHTNSYTYSDGKTETENFGPYKKPETRSLFLDSCFSWGSDKVEAGASFAFETGFRCEERRLSVPVVYDNQGLLQKVLVISEKLDNYAEETNNRELNLPGKYQADYQTNYFDGEWQGFGKIITPNWIVSSLAETSWDKIKNVSEGYEQLIFPDKVVLTCPQKIEPGKDFIAAVDWLISSHLLHRCIRVYGSSGLQGVSLEIFNRVA